MFCREQALQKISLHFHHRGDLWTSQELLNLLVDDTNLLLDGRLITIQAHSDFIFEILLLLSDRIQRRKNLIHKLRFILVRQDLLNLETCEKF